MSEVSEGIVKVLKLLIPPNTNDLGPQQRWRWTVFAVIVTMFLTQVATFAVEHGYTPWPGYAYDTTVSALQFRVDLSTQVLLERDMKDKQKDLCTTKDSGYKRELSDDIDNLQREYRKITGHFYPLRSDCKNL